MKKRIKKLTNGDLELAFNEIKEEEKQGELVDGIVWSIFEEENEKDKSISLQEVEKEILMEIAERTYTKENTYIIFYYDRIVNEKKTMELEAKNSFRAGREFYRRKSVSSFFNYIEKIVRK